jgi:hypothetical protein
MAKLQATEVSGDIVVSGEVIELGSGVPSGTVTLASTDELPEGSTNLYYTDNRVENYLGNVGTDLLPAADNTYDIGSPSLQWADLYLSGSTVYINTI